MEHLLQWSKCSTFHNIFKYVNNNSKEQKALFKGVKRRYNGVNLQTATEPHSHCYCLIMRLTENTASYNFGQTKRNSTSEGVEPTNGFKEVKIFIWIMSPLW